MAYVKPGEHPLVDMFEYNKHPFPYDVEMMLRKIDEIDTDLLDQFEGYYIYWVKGEKLAEGRSKLKETLKNKNLSDDDIKKLTALPKPDASVLWIRRLSKIIAVLWLLWWLIFTVRLYTQENTNIEPDWTNLLLLGIFIVSVFIPFKWEPLGGILLVLEGLFITVAYMDDTPREEWLQQAALLIIVGIPAVIAGLGFLIAWVRSRRLSFKQTRNR